MELNQNIYVYHPHISQLLPEKKWKVQIIKVMISHFNGELHDMKARDLLLLNVKLFCFCLVFVSFVWWLFLFFFIF